LEKERIGANHNDDDDDDDNEDGRINKNSLMSIIS
jgi:hypothetical protein